MRKQIHTITVVTALTLITTLVATGCQTQTTPQDNHAYPLQTRTPIDNQNQPFGNDLGIGDSESGDKVGDLRDNIDNDRMGTIGEEAEANMRFSAEMATKLGNLPEIDQAVVLSSGHHVYVAVKTTGTYNLTNNARKRISQEVRHVDRDVREVHISADPQFYENMIAYSEAIQKGKPLQGLISDLTETLRRTFPESD